MLYYNDETIDELKTINLKNKINTETRQNQYSKIY